MNVLRMSAALSGLAIRRQIRLLAGLSIVALASMEALDWMDGAPPAHAFWRLAAVVLVSAAILYLCRQLELGIMRPLRRIDEAVGRWTGGDFDFRASIGGPPEIRVLGERLNRMASELELMCRDHVTIADALRASEGRLQAALESGAVAIWDTDLGSGQCWLSEGWAAMRGAASGPARMSLQELAELTHPDDLDEIRRASRDVILGRSAFYEREHRIRDASGGWRWILSRGRVSARDERGRATRMSGTNVDITDRKRQERELVEAKAALEERVAARTRELVDTNRELEAFAYTVSHDLRAPLRFMGGCTRLVESALDEGSPGRARELLHAIDDGASRMLRLIEGLLEFSRLGRHPIERRIVDLRAVVDEALGELAPRNFEVSVGELPAVSADPMLARQVFANLLANAAKYAGRRERPRIEVGSERRDGETVIYVRDNGVGFSMRDAGRLFEAFQRLHPESQFPGVGVGLAIVKRIVERHGGRVWAESEVGKGATFRFTLGDPHPSRQPA